jgi:hypothetical protein
MRYPRRRQRMTMVPWRMFMPQANPISPVCCGVNSIRDPGFLRVGHARNDWRRPLQSWVVIVRVLPHTRRRERGLVEWLA